jgi:IMP dehydrogenase
MRKAYTFEDVALIPQYNNINSRLEPSLHTNLTVSRKINFPIIPSNMDTVICPELARLIIANGGIPIFHRFATFEKQQEWVREFGEACFISAGLTKYNETVELLKLGAGGVCIDIAHGHSNSMISLIKQLKTDFPTKCVIAGNVCTAIGFRDLVLAGADAVKVGIGPGGCCTTRMVTGFGMPQFTAIQECAIEARRLKVPLIADGGIKNTRDMVLALAAGANSVMMGSMFARTTESAAPKTGMINPDGTTDIVCMYRGQASQMFQEDFYGGVKKNTVPEGVHFQMKCSGSAQLLIDEYCGALRSALTYGGARNISELQRKAEFVEVTSNYMGESKPRQIT